MCMCALVPADAAVHHSWYASQMRSCSAQACTELTLRCHMSSARMSRCGCVAGHTFLVYNNNTFLFIWTDQPFSFLSTFIRCIFQSCCLYRYSARTTRVSHRLRKKKTANAYFKSLISLWACEENVAMHHVRYSVCACSIAHKWVHILLFISYYDYCSTYVSPIEHIIYNIYLSFKQIVLNRFFCVYVQIFTFFPRALYYFS